MWDMDTISGFIEAILIAFALERLLHHLKRRTIEDFNRYRLLEQIIDTQSKTLADLLDRASISPSMRRFTLELSKAIGSHRTSLQFAAWMDKGKRKPKVLPCENRLIREWKELQSSDPRTAHLLLAYFSRSSYLALLLWNESLRSVEWLADEMAGDSVETRLHRAALLDTAYKDQAKQGAAALVA